MEEGKKRGRMWERSRDGTVREGGESKGGKREGIIEKEKEEGKMERGGQIKRYRGGRREEGGSWGWGGTGGKEWEAGQSKWFVYFGAKNTKKNEVQRHTHRQTHTQGGAARGAGGCSLSVRQIEKSMKQSTGDCLPATHTHARNNFSVIITISSIKPA